MKRLKQSRPSPALIVAILALVAALAVKRLKQSRPSPALIVAILALVAAFAGTAVAADRW
jgi:hypothetical protein